MPGKTKKNILCLGGTEAVRHLYKIYLRLTCISLILQLFAHFAASGQQQVQDQHVPRPSSAGRLSKRNQLYICTHAGRAGEVSEHAHTL